MWQEKEIRSRLFEKFKITSSHWVVTLLNVAKGSGQFIGGHAMLIVEGLEQEDEKYIPKMFIGKYDIYAELENGSNENKISENLGFISSQQSRILQTAYNFVDRNKEGIVTTVNVNESNDYGKRDYADCKISYSGVFPKANVLQMIADIKADRAKTIKTWQACQAGEPNASAEFIKYTFLDHRHPLSASEDGVNCQGWCLNKLEILGVDIQKLSTKPAKKCVIL